ncbi:putative phosphatidate phosphatase [Helianthus annuus]|nr:putative phosphatidate phosphatase [Helianthus annuus]
MAIFIDPPPTLNYHPKFKNFLCKTRPSCPSFCTLKQSTIVYRKSNSFKKTMASLSMETNFISVVDDDHKHISHKISGVHILVNTLSKWVVALTLGGFIILRHDALALWAATGSVSNYILSIALKRVLKQKRPVSDEGLGPGMPSSHAQTVFFTLVFVIVSGVFLLRIMTVIERMGLSGATMALGILLVAIGSYFSWLRVLLGYHTTSQVFVGTIVGSNVAILWFWAWEAIVSKAYNSNPWVQILLMIGVVCYYLVFIFYILWHVIKY